MSESDQSTELREFIASALRGKVAYGERFSMYLTNKGRSEAANEPQVEIPDWESWIRRAVDILGSINGGATATAPATGLYIDRERQSEQVWERTVVVYSFIDRKAFRERITEIREFAHEYGRTTRQGSVFFEFDGYAYEIQAPFD